MILKFETDRLVCFPITNDDFYNAINNSENFIKKYSYPFPISAYYGEENFHKIGTEVYEKSSKDKSNYFWYTPWLIRLKKTNDIIGILNFKGPISKKSEIAIGYGIEPEYRNKGYASETIKGAIQWTKTSNNVKRIFAFTAKDNIYSQGVLKKNQFVLHGEIEDEFIWKYQI